MLALAAIRSALATVPVRRLKATLVRCVALRPLIEVGSPDFLFTSGRANRYNPVGVACVYFSEDERTARAEYDRRATHRSGALQPLGTFFADVVRRICNHDSHAVHALSEAGRKSSNHCPSSGNLYNSTVNGIRKFASFLRSHPGSCRRPCSGGRHSSGCVREDPPGAASTACW